MKIPISDILDRYSIDILKKERANAENFKEIHDLKFKINKYSLDYKQFIDQKITDLIEVNGKIWDLESDIRKGKEDLMGLEEVGRRAIKIREYNKIKIRHKNDIVNYFGEGYKKIKINNIRDNE
jgi:hypothetical protein